MAQDFDPVNPDYSLLKNLVLEKLNQKRAKKNNTTLTNNASLQITANTYVSLFSYTKLEKNEKNKLRINKKIKKNCQLNGYKNAFIDYHIASINCMNFNNKIFYYDKEDAETTTHLFIGNKPTKKEKAKDGFVANPIKPYSYNQLADLIVRQFVTDDGSFKILNNGFDKFGFELAVERRTLFKKKIPKIKIIIILGGNRITW